MSLASIASALTAKVPLKSQSRLGSCSFLLLCYSSNAAFFLLLCHCNLSIMLKIMLGFHRNNHKPRGLDTNQVTCDILFL